MPAGRPTKYTPQMCEDLIEAGKQGMGKAEMAAHIGIHRDTLNDWGKNNPEFSAALKEAVSQSQAWWERKGREGATGEVDGFNSTAWIFNMKNRFREDWRDKHEVEATHDVSDRLSDLMGQVAQRGKRIGDDT